MEAFVNVHASVLAVIFGAKDVIEDALGKLEGIGSVLAAPKQFLKLSHWLPHFFKRNWRPHRHLPLQDDVERVAFLAVADDEGVLGGALILKTSTDLVHLVELELALFKETDIGHEGSQHCAQLVSASLLSWLRQNAHYLVELLARIN